MIDSEGKLNRRYLHVRSGHGDLTVFGCPIQSGATVGSVSRFTIRQTTPPGPQMNKFL
jgi:hypothetical protein